MNGREREGEKSGEGEEGVSEREGKRRGGEERVKGKVRES